MDSENYKFTVCIEPDEDEYHGWCPEISGLHVPGKTLPEVVQNIADAFEGWILSKQKHNEELSEIFDRQSSGADKSKATHL